MATFQVKTKNQVEIQRKPRVYFTCHPEDFEPYFLRLCQDIFKTQDCAIYYTTDMTEQIPDGDKEVDLGRNNLFVVPVTAKLLTTPNRAMDADIPYAIQARIPVLPIMVETGLDVLYSKADKFGEMQFLKLCSTDITEIAYEEKLCKYLQSVLTDDALAKRIRDAFDAYIFLSYRKKDRKHANALMRRIHAHPACHNIAIWFDEFLTPGESFRQNIERILDRCQLFTLLVTPQLFEKVVDQDGNRRDNYVISTELPLAKKKKAENGTDILAVEMEKTDRAQLSAIEIEDQIKPNDTAFDARLSAAVSHITGAAQHTPEHSFLIGMAYFDGIDMEVDRQRGAALIQSAAENHHIEAIEKMVAMYEHGIYFPRDLQQAILWQNRLILALEKRHKKPHSPDALVTLFWARYHCAHLYLETTQYDFAENKIRKIWPELLSCRSRKGSIATQRADITECLFYGLLCLSDISNQKGDLPQAEHYLEQAQSIYRDIMVPMDPSDDRDDTIRNILVHYVISYLQIGKLNKELGHYEQALTHACKALDMIQKHLPQTCHLYDIRLEIEANEIAGDALFQNGQQAQAESHYQAMYSLAQQNAAEQPNPTTQRDLAFACNRLGDCRLQSARFREAKKYYRQSRRICADIQAPTYDDLENLAFCDTRFGDLCWYQRMHPQIPYYYYKKAYRRRRKLFETYRNAQTKKHLAYSYFNLARVSLFLGRYYFNKAKALFAELAKESQIPDCYQKEWERLEDLFKRKDF